MSKTTAGDVEICRMVAAAAADPNQRVPDCAYGEAGCVVAAALSTGRVVIAARGAEADLLGAPVLVVVVVPARTAEIALAAILGATGHQVTQIRVPA